jgi:5-(carboxyamino)imidazole ribonucleotide synthase
VLKPEATIGILGGGQLGRMLALAAARLGFKCHVFAPHPDSPAFEVVRRVTRADYTDTGALARFAENVDVVTYEFENVPAETATFLAARVPVLPDPKILATTQDRLAEKNFVTALGIRTAAFADVGSAGELPAALTRIGRPAILKTRRFGYDGKGQATIENGSDPAAAWRDVGGQPCILEAFVPFEREVSIIAARGHDGAVACFDVTENEHSNHILKFSRVPRSARRTPRRRGASPKPSPINSPMWACLRSRCSSSAMAALSSTRSRRGCIIPVIGRSTALRCRNSSSTSGRSRAGRWESRCAMAASR